MSGLLGFGRDTLQATSNAIAGNVAGPVDLINAGLLGLGLPMPAKPFGGSAWMAERGLTREVADPYARVAGETLGLVGPTVVAAKAPQIARGLLTMADNAMAPSPFNAATRRQGGAVLPAGKQMPQSAGMSIDDYGLSHRPMTQDGGAASLHDLAKVFGDDIYDARKALQYFGSGDPRERNALKVMHAVRGNPDATVTIYRGVPDGVNAINPGDWVTLDKAVAADYGGRVLKMQVPASHITSWPDSLLEFGYYPPTAPR